MGTRQKQLSTEFSGDKEGNHDLRTPDNDHMPYLTSSLMWPGEGTPAL